MNGDLDAMLEEAVLGVMSSIDAPGSPAGEVRAAFHHLFMVVPLTIEKICGNDILRSGRMT